MNLSMRKAINPLFIWVGDQRNEDFLELSLQIRCVLTLTSFPPNSTTFTHQEPMNKVKRTCQFQVEK